MTIFGKIDHACISAHRGVPRIFCRGFPQVVGSKTRGSGAQPPDADEFFYLLCQLVAYRTAGFLREDFNIALSTFRNIKIRIVFVKRGDL